jgi:hypothetical protein
MKLYTEEQLKEAFNCGRLYKGIEGDLNIYHLIDKLTPIELPSDEEILKNAIKPLHGLMDEWDKGFLFGAKWMRNKIQGGNK